MTNKEISQQAENYIEENNIQQNTYAIEKAFRDGAKMVLNTVKNNVAKSNVSRRSELLCDHEWVDARNEIIKSGLYCSKCRKLKA